MKKKLKFSLSVFGFCVLFVFVFQSLSMLIPYRDPRERRVWHEIYENPNSVSYLFVGSSHVYCGVRPDVIEQKTGKKAMLISSGLQTLEESYYSAEEALKYQHPETLYVELYGAYKTFEKENYTNLDNMRLSPAKVKLVRTGFSDISNIDALFPLIRQHSNWKDFDNIKDNFEKKYLTIPFENGFSGIDSSMPDDEYQGYLDMEEDKTPFVLKESDRKMIQKFKKLGEREHVRIVFFLTPFLDEFTEKIDYGSFLKEINQETGGVFVLSRQEYYGIGLSRETFIQDKVSDNQHLNLRGAELYTEYLAEKTMK